MKRMQSTALLSIQQIKQIETKKKIKKYEKMARISALSVCSPFFGILEEWSMLSSSFPSSESSRDVSNHRDSFPRHFPLSLIDLVAHFLVVDELTTDQQRLLLCASQPNDSSHSTSEKHPCTNSFPLSSPFFTLIPVLIPEPSSTSASFFLSFFRV